MKLMDIDSDTLGIPDTDYDARVTMSSTEFARIVRDLSLLGESVRIEVSKEGIRFASDGESANGNVLLKETDAARRKYKDYGVNGEASQTKNEEDGDDADEGEEDGEKKSKKKEKVKKEKEDGDVEMDDEEEGEEEFKPKSDDEGEGEEEDGESENKKKRKNAPAKVRVLVLSSRLFS
jgi:proliferating cell nuclear antigen